jgi:NAD+ kinase
MGNDPSPPAERHVAFVVHPFRPEAAQLAARAEEWWARHGYQVDQAGEKDLADAVPAGTFEFAISLGGDGTMLRTVAFTAGRGIPVLGVNLGSLGYLAQVEPSAMEAAFDRLVAGDYEVEERMVLAIRVRRSAADDMVVVGLNEAAVVKTTPGRTIRLDLAIAGHPFLSYVVDGVIVATPTGSTGYNLSLRGPIVSPQLRLLIVTPISPHMLFDRSLVLDPDEVVRIEPKDGPLAVLVVDGSTVVPVGPDDAVEVSGSRQPAHVVRFGPPRFHSILRAKFGLGER